MKRKLAGLRNLGVWLLRVDVTWDSSVGARKMEFKVRTLRIKSDLLRGESK